MKKFLCCIFITLLLLSLVSCNGVTNDNRSESTDSDAATDTSEIKKGYTVGYKLTAEESEARKEYEYNAAGLTWNKAYNNFIFGQPKAANNRMGMGSYDIVFYDVTYMTEEPMSVFLDSVGSSPFSDDPGSSVFIEFIIIDRYSSDKNAGLPTFILYLAGSQTVKSGCYMYNMETRELNMLFETYGDERYPEACALYGDTIYYTYNDGDNGDVLCSIKLDGTDKKRHKNELKCDLFILSANDEYVFYQNANDGTIYRCDTNFENITEYALSLSNDGYIYNGYFYYLDNRDNIDIVDGKEVITGNLVKKPIGADINDPDEIVWKSPYNMQFQNGFMYTKKYNPTYYGGYLSYAENTFLKVNLDTLESEVVLEYTDRDDVILRAIALCGDSLSFSVTPYKDGNYAGTGTAYNAYYNFETKIWQDVFVNYYKYSD